MMDRALHTCSVIFLFVCASVAFAAEKASPFTISPQAAELLESYCFDCHDADSKKGDVQLGDLVGLSLKNRLDLLNIIDSIAILLYNDSC